jgi:hypothetical protein
VQRAPTASTVFFVFSPHMPGWGKMQAKKQPTNSIGDIIDDIRD